jgi:hypothetical protein
MIKWLAGLLVLGGCQAVEIPAPQPVRIAKVRPVAAPAPRVAAPVARIPTPLMAKSRVSTEYGI